MFTGTRINAICATSLVICSLMLPPALDAATGQDNAGRQHEKQMSEHHLQRGREAIQTKDYERALAEIKRAWLYDSESGEVNLLLAIVHDQLGNKKDAGRYLEEALKLQPRALEAHFLLARWYYEDNNPADARRNLDVVFSLNDQYAPAYGLKGDLEITEGKYQEAIASFQEALRLATEDDEWRAGIQKRIETLSKLLEMQGQQNDSAYTRPHLLNAPHPSYTEEARRNKINGTVQMFILINEQGEVISTLSLTRLGHGLDEQAAKAARTMKFSPALKEDKPVPFWLKVDIEFNLR